MVKIFCIVLTLILCLGLAEAEQKIVAVKSFRIKPYDEALRGFKSACNVTVKEIVISEQKGVDVVREVLKVNPDIILAVGIDALSKVKKIKDIPIVYVMVSHPHSILSNEKNITGVSMNIPLERQLNLLREVLPDVIRVGLLYDPARTGFLVEKALYYSRKPGIKLIAKEVYSSRDVPSILNSMKGGIDALWMIPDTSVITPETVEFFFLFSLENSIPVITFSDKYLELGAVISVGIDAFDMGRQAGEIAQEILSGKDIKTISRVDARKAVLTINLKIAKKLGIRINNDAISRAKIID